MLINMCSMKLCRWIYIEETFFLNFLLIIYQIKEYNYKIVLLQYSCFVFYPALYDFFSYKVYMHGLLV